MYKTAYIILRSNNYVGFKPDVINISSINVIRMEINLASCINVITGAPNLESEILFHRSTPWNRVLPDMPIALQLV